MSNPVAKHAYLTLVGEKPLLNVVLENSEILCIEIKEAHLRNLAADAVAMALRGAGEGGE